MGRTIAREFGIDIYPANAPDTVMLSRIALGGIWAYQRWVSPHKGYRCAYAVVHGGTGCSGYVKQTIRTHGLWGARAAIKARFAACRDAHEDIQSEKRKKRPEGSRKRDYCCDAPSACGGVSPCSPYRGSKSGFCDTNPCDGDLGCGGCDVCSCW